MGMFDIIEIGKIKCPLCKNMTYPGLQTKGAIMPSMNEFKIGDKFPLDTQKGMLGMHKKQYSIDVLGSCDSCGASIDGWARIDVKTKRITEVDLYTVHQEINPPIIRKYKPGVNNVKC